MDLKGGLPQEASGASSSDARWTALIALGAVASSVSCAIALHGAGDRSDAAIVVAVTWIWGAFAVLPAVRRPPISWIWAPLLVAMLVRAPLIGVPPLLSDDVYRYLWEGLALGHGHNPFTTPPAAIHGLDDALRDRVNHNHIGSIYPPLALWWFRALSMLGGSVWTAQLATGLTDLISVAAMIAVLRRRTRSLWPVWVYALHPLPALESAAGAHIDLLAITFAVLAIAAFDRGWFELSFGALTAGAAVKLFPALIAVPVLRQLWPGRAVAVVLAGCTATLALGLGVLDAGPALADAMGTYSRTWSFNGLVFPWVSPVLGAATRPVLIAIGGAAVCWSWWRHRDPLEAWATVGAAFVVLSPTVHPWYVLWVVVPTLLLGRLAWACAAIPLLGSYAVLTGFDASTGAWVVPSWLWLSTWGPALAMLLWVGRRGVPSDAIPTDAYPTVKSARNGSEAM